MVSEVWKSTARCIGAMPVGSWCHRGTGADGNSTGSGKVERATEAACWHH